jgi:endo-1,3-1,4-beta-glycanase ExoK
MEGQIMGMRSLCLKAKTAALAVFLVVLATVLPCAPASGKGNKDAHSKSTASAWQDDFSSSQLDPTIWVVGNGQAPGAIANYHVGNYDPSHVKVVSDSSGNYLQLLLTQEIGTVGTNPGGTISHGALIYTKKTYGYGTYEMRMRMSSTSSTPTGYGEADSGSVSAGFEYVNNSQTEIDFEFSALSPDTLYMVNWLNPRPRLDPTPADQTFDALYPFTVSTEFHDYKFVWEPSRITFYVDGVQEAVHTTNVPSAPAYFMINHWGTDSGNWGGTATVGVPRYFYVDWVKYTPPQ